MKTNLATARQSFFASNPEFLDAFIANQSLPASSFRDSITEQFEFRGKLSEKQVAAFVTAVRKDIVFAERQAAWKAEQQAKTASLIEAGVQAPVGRTRIEGVVSTVKFVQNDFGGANKMLVELASGAKVWLSVPSEVVGCDAVALCLGTDEIRTALVGKTISVTATFKQKEGDATFAFGSRPNKATVL